MMKAMVVSLIMTVAIQLTVGLVIEKPSCGAKFYCPDHCNITWRNNCPRNCFCGPIKYCPSVVCPAPYPVCIVFTRLDGCQSCACKIPFAFLKANGTISENSIVYDTGRLKDLEEGRNITGEVSDEHDDSIKKMMCTIQNMNHVDYCLRKILDFHRFSRDRKRDDQPITINPMVLLGDRDMKALCRLFTEAVQCIGSRIYHDCRRDHPDLSEIDSLLKYACGPKSPQFFQHLPCITDAHRRSIRVQLCEDSFVNSMVAIDESPGTPEAKRVHKCGALNWLLKCGRASVHRYCSPAAADVYAQSLVSVAEYIAPECNPDTANARIVPKTPDTIGITFSNLKEPLQCSLSNQFIIFASFKPLYNELRSLSSSITPAFPIAYTYEVDSLLEKCRDFRKALYAIDVNVRKRCYRNFEVFDQVYGALAYSCGPETKDAFFHHFPCLSSLRANSEIVDCELEAARHLRDPNVDQCEVFQLLANCIKNTVESTCGEEAWNIHSQLMSIAVRRYVPECEISLVYRLSRNKTNSSSIQ